MIKLEWLDSKHRPELLFLSGGIHFRLLTDAQGQTWSNSLPLCTSVLSGFHTLVVGWPDSLMNITWSGFSSLSSPSVLGLDTGGEAVSK